MLYDFVNTELDLFNKLREDKANAQLKRFWFKKMMGNAARWGSRCWGSVDAPEF